MCGVLELMLLRPPGSLSLLQRLYCVAMAVEATDKEQASDRVQRSL